MAATHNTQATLDSMWKEVYPQGVNNVVPNSRILIREIPFSNSYKLGDKYVEPVLLSQEHGVTYLGQNYGVDTLEDSEAAVYKEAQVDGYGMLLRSSISYNAADKMMSSKAAFASWSTTLVENMVESITKRQELGMIYGQVGIGEIDSTSVSTDATLTLKTASWADGIWAGMENAKLDAFNGTSKRNSNAVLKVESVDFDARQVVVSGNGTDLNNLAQGDVLYFRNANSGSGNFKEAPGLQAIATNTGTLFNIDASTYSLWKGVTTDVSSSEFTLSKLLKGVASAAGRGLDEDLDVLIGTQTFRDLNSDQAALKRHHGERKEAKNGYEYLEFCSQNGKLRIVPHIYVKEGDAFGVPKTQMKRIGATDTTFKLPQADPDRVFLHIPDKAGYELRCRSEFTIYCRRPAQLIYFKNIVNS